MTKQNTHEWTGAHAGDEMLAVLADSLVQDETGAQAPDVPGEVLDHVDQCRECKDKVMDVVLFMRNPEAPGIPIQVPRFVREKVAVEKFPLTLPQGSRSFYTGKIAAVLVACAVMVGAYFLVFKGSPPLQDTPTAPGVSEHSPALQPDKADTSAPAEAKQQPSPGTAKKNGATRYNRFRVNPTLENMIGSRLRSGIFEAVSPVNNGMVRGDIRFAWKKKLAKSHTLKIVNNRNRVLHTYQVSGASFDFKEKLPAGLYYWKLESENELLYVGKFYKGSSR
jgi:hypothetical protein